MRNAYFTLHAQNRLEQYKITEEEARREFNDAVKIVLLKEEKKKYCLGNRHDWSQKFKGENLVFIVQQRNNTDNDYTVITLYPKDSVENGAPTEKQKKLIKNFTEKIFEYEQDIHPSSDLKVKRFKDYLIECSALQLKRPLDAEDINALFNYFMRIKVPPECY